MSSGYKTVVIYDENLNKDKITTLHRLVAMAWVPNKDYVKNYVVDHKDGNKLNNHATNLQWLSMRYNSAKVKTDTVYVINVLTKEIKKFNSLSDVAKFVQQSRSEILFKYFPLCVGTKDGNLYYITIKGDFNIKPEKCELRRGILVKIDNEWKYFYHVNDLNNYFNTEYKSFTEFKNLNKDKYKIVMMKRPLQTDKWVKNIKTGEVRKFKTLSEVAEYTGLNKRLMRKVFAERKFNLIFNNKWLFSDSGAFVGEEDWEISNYGLKYKLEKDDDVLIFKSIREIARHFGVDKRTIMKHLKSGITHGYRVTLVR